MPRAPGGAAAPSMKSEAYAAATAGGAPSDVAVEESAPMPPPAQPSAPAGAVAPTPMPAPRASTAYVGPSASVRAGEWDDNANYQEFQKWLATEGGTPFHKVDVRERRFLVVQDADGKPVPGCRVTVADDKQHQVSLVTSTAGRAILFPHAEGLVGQDLGANATCAEGTARATIKLGEGDGVVAMKLAAKRALPASRSIDVAFILDTTGSMGEEIAAVKSTIQKVASSLDRGEIKVRIGMVAFKDRGDEYVTKVYPMTTDLVAFQKDVSNVHASGGGDTPESVNEGVHVALTKLEWRSDAVARFAFLIGDAPPHLDYAQDFDYAVDMRDAAHRGIKMFTIAASGMDDLGQVVFRQIAAYTGASNMFVLRGGAGPQSTGAGDPKSSCGGTHSSYASGNLDALIVRKIRGELGALDRNPLAIPGLGKDENAKPCSERLIAE